MLKTYIFAPTMDLFQTFKKQLTMLLIRVFQKPKLNRSQSITSKKTRAETKRGGRPDLSLECKVCLMLRSAGRVGNMSLTSSAGTLKKTKIKDGAKFKKYNGLLLNRAENHS